MMLDYVITVVSAGWLTLEVALLSLFFAVLLGLFGAICKLSANRLLAGAADAYTSVIRGIPDLVMMLLIFYIFTTADSFTARGKDFRSAGFGSDDRSSSRDR